MSAKAIISALPCIIRQNANADAYKIYMSDTLRAVVEIAAGFGGVKNLDFPRYADIIDPKPVETRTPEEIIAEIKRKSES
jgi:hypothetical protein